MFLKKRTAEIISFFIPLAILLLGLITAKIFDLLSIREFLVGALFIIILILGNSVIVSKILANKIYSELSMSITNLKSIIKSSTPHHNWLIQETELLEIERAIECSDIWICVFDLSSDTSDSGLAVDVVKYNISRGIKYTFILPDTNTIRVKLPALKELFDGNTHLLSLKIIPEEDFRSFAFGDIAVYNPSMSQNKKVQAFLELPVDVPNVWVKISDEHIYDLVGRIKKYV